MLPLAGNDLLRIAVLSGILGFAAFCLSYGIYVWRRRNSAGRPSKSRTTRLAQLLAALGCTGIAISWGHNEFQGRAGIAGGSGLFVVHARRASATQQVTPSDTVAQGDVVAEFLSPAERTRLAAVDMQQAQARAKKNAIENAVLQSDHALLQEQAHLRSELLQLKGFAFELRKSRHEIERDRTNLVTTWTREDSQLLADIAAAERELETAVSRRELARRALQRGQELQTQGHVTQQELDARSAEHLTAELNLKKHKNSLASLQERRAALEKRFGASEASFAQQVSEIANDSAKIDGLLASIEAKARETDRELREDRARAVLSRQGEAEAVDYDITILSAERARLTEAAQVRAPLAGQVIYRHPAPGLASENSPILAISAGTGFTAKIRLPRRELEELAAEAEPVQLSLENPVLHHFFTGRFVRSEPVPFEPGRVIAYLDCSLPPEVISYLGSTADPVRVRLLWRPSLTKQPGFQVSVLALVAGVLSFGLGARHSAPAAKRSGGLSPAEAARSVDSSRIMIDKTSRDSDLRSLARIFLRQLRTRPLEPELVAEVEQMLNRSHGQAMQILVEELRNGSKLDEATAEWMGQQDAQTRQRFAAILKTAQAPARSDGDARG